MAVKIKNKSAHVVYQPLSYEFEMRILGGSTDQVFDSLSKQYQPDRHLVPLTLQPHLFVTDPDNVISSGVMTQFLVNVVWELYLVDSVAKRRVQLTPGLQTYVVYDKGVIIYYNVPLGYALSVSFRADFVDSRRNETQQFEWSQTLSSGLQEIWKPTLEVQSPSRVLLSPFKERGIVSIPVIYRNGEDERQAAVYDWQYLTSKGEWQQLSRAVELEDYPPLCIIASSVGTSTLQIEQKYVQDICVRCVAWGEKDNERSMVVGQVVRLRRYYGQYEERMDILEGQVMKPGQKQATVEIVVTRLQGVVTNPMKDFFIDIYHAVDDGDFQHVSYQAKHTEFANDFTKNEHHFGYAVREKSALVPLVMPDGKYLAVGGKVLVAQVPQVEIEE